MPEVGKSSIRQIAKLIGAIIIAVASVASTAMYAQHGTSKFSLAISTSKNEFKLGDRIVLDITFHNASNKTLPWGESGTAEYGNDIIVTHEDGSPVLKTLYGKCSRLSGDAAQRADCPSSGSIGGGISSFEPGGDAHDSSVISDLYEITQPGNYRIFVRSEVPPQIGHGTAMSNTITITVKG